MDMDAESVRRFYRRLDHAIYGVTELVVIDPGKGVIATGFFSNEDVFVKACGVYSGRYNIYAARNPRPKWFPRACENYLDTKYRQRAKDSDIEHITAISLDIDPIRPKGTSATERQHRTAIDFAVSLHNEIGGWVDDSGNGAYLWIPFKTPIRVDNENRDEIKQKCRLWQINIAKVHRPEDQNLRIDGCFDLSRLKKVIGTISVKGHIHRVSSFVKESQADDKVRDAILSLELNTNHTAPVHVKPRRRIPQLFLSLLKTNNTIRQLWLTPNGDASMHDWALGCELIKSGVSDASDLARILMLNPFGKYQRDRRYEYLQSTVRNLISKSD